MVGVHEGMRVGPAVGEKVGIYDGSLLGETEGVKVGEAVYRCV